MKRILSIGLLLITYSVFSFAYQPIIPTQEENDLFQDQVLIFSGNSNHQLAEDMANYLGIELGKAKIGRFNDGEIQIHIEQSVRGKDVVIVQPTCRGDEQSINDNLMELYLLVRTMKRSFAQSITAVIPYYGYARQDLKTEPRVPISASDVALLLETAGVDRVMTVDLHCGQIQGFFHYVPVDNLYAATMFVQHYAQKDLKNVVVVSPDAGGVERAKRFMENLNHFGIPSRLAMISKQRAKAGVVDKMSLIGEVADSDVIIVDDLCDTGGTLVLAAQVLKDNGANRVFVAVTHPVFSGNALEKIQNSVIDEMVISDTIPLSGELPPNLVKISVAPLLGEAIRRIYLSESISDLFR